MNILFLVPLLSFFAIFLVVYYLFPSSGIYMRIREAFTRSVLITGVFIVLITELLSYYESLSFGWLLGAWLLFLLFLAIYIFYKKLYNAALAGIWKATLDVFKKEPLVCVILLLLIVSLFAALIYPTNNYDSLTYHMARVGHWEQNHSISHYKTHITRQIEFPPFAEWVILHLQLLTGGDRFANSVQLFFMAGCVVIVSLVAAQLGANRKQQILSSCVACFIPMAILESNTTQNDIVASFFVLCFCYYSLRILRERKRSSIFFAGASLGLAWFTKSTSYIFTFLVCGWYIIVLAKDFRKPVKIILKNCIVLMVVPLIAMVINSGHFYRNVFYTGSPLGNGSSGTVNEGFEVKPLLLVAAKNVMNHLPVTPSMKDKIAGLGVSWGIDPDDPKYNMTRMGLMIQGYSFHEDYAQNFFHLILIALCLLAYFLHKSTYNKPPGAYLLYILTLLGITVIFSVALKWQPWSNRLETPLFMLFSVFIGMELYRFFKIFRFVALAGIIIYGFIALAYNYRHPFFPVSGSIFSDKLNYDNFIYDKKIGELKKYIDKKSYKNIGLFIGPDDWDYVYFKSLREDNKDRIIKHVFVSNASTMYVEDFVPDVIISNQQSVKQYNTRGRDYFQSAIIDNLVVFELKP